MGGAERKGQTYTATLSGANANCSSDRSSAPAPSNRHWFRPPWKAEGGVLSQEALSLEEFAEIF